MAKNSRWAKDFITVCKRMADPPESFNHRCSNHNVVSIMFRGKKRQYSFASTPSDRHSFNQLMRTFSKGCNDYGWPDEKVFKGKKHLRLLCKPNDQQ